MTTHRAKPNGWLTPVDPITLTVIWNTLLSIAEELGITLRNTAFSEACARATTSPRRCSTAMR